MFESPDYIPEGLNLCIEGPQRKGKTLLLTMLAADALHQGRTIHSTYNLAFPHKALDFSDLTLRDGSRRFWNGFVAIDELNFFFDARNSMSRQNRVFGAYLLQQKKQGCTIAGTTHGLAYLDVRYRQNYDYILTPETLPGHPYKPETLKVTIENGPLQAPLFRTIYLDCRPYLGLYDTFNVYDPFPKDQEKPARKTSGPVTSGVKL